MILTETERIRLLQLRDSDHPLTIRGTHLPDIDQNKWAVQQVWDWRMSHPDDCPICLEARRNHHQRSRRQPRSTARRPRPRIRLARTVA